MLPFIYIFGKQIPMYALMAAAGCIAICLMSVKLAKVRGEVPAEDIFYMLLYAGIGCMIGAKALYLLISVKTYLLPERSLVDNLKYWFALLTSGGMVFYGGLAGAVLGALRYCLHFRIPVKSAFETAVPAVPLFHAFGRIGCFMSGCCYGIEYHGALAVTFSDAIAAPNGVPLLPIQLFEAFGNLLLTAVLTCLFLKNIPRLSLCGVYLMSYAVMRFILEFFRGDSVRGKLLVLSSSQWISMAAFAAGAFIIVKEYRGSPKENIA